LFVGRRRAEEIRIVLIVGAAAFLELEVGVGCPRLTVLVPRVGVMGFRIQGSGLRVPGSGFRARV